MSDYLDGDLHSAARGRMERHLRECAECRRLVAGLRQTLDELHRLVAPGPGVDAVQLAAAVQARLSEVD